MSRTRLVALFLCLFAAAVSGAAWAAETVAPYPHGHRSQINGCAVLHLAGTGEQLGSQQARLARHLVRQVVDDVIVNGEGANGRHEKLIEGAMVMEKYLPAEYRAELRALAKGAEVSYPDIVALQLFGDVQRGQLCTSYAVFGPATANGECIVGRNMDFIDHGVSSYAACLIHYTPASGIPFVTTSWCGIINGWTAMNACGIVCANNSAYGGKDSLEGLSTCFMVRKVAQFAHTVEEGVRIVQETPRACGTNLIIAGGDPPNAAIVEFDHDQAIVRWAKKGYVCAANNFRALGFKTPTSAEEGLANAITESGATAGNGAAAGTGGAGHLWLTRDELLTLLIRDNYGRIDDTMNFAAAEGVPIRSMNLHSALLFPQRRAFRVSMGKVPAADYPYRRFRLTEGGVVSDE